MNDSSYPCPRCKKICTSKSGLSKHMNLLHLELSPSQVQHARDRMSLLRKGTT